MMEKLRKSDVLRNHWLPLILCVVLFGAWWLRWEPQGSHTLGDGTLVRWYVDRWTGCTWIRANSIQVSGSAPMPRTQLEADELREFQNSVRRHADGMLRAWGVGFIVSLLWLGFALTVKSKVAPETRHQESY